MPDGERKGLGGARRWALPGALALVLLAADQASKFLVARRLFPGEVLRVTPFVNFSLNHNTGGVFSLFPGRPLVFTVLSLAALVLLGYLFVKLEGRTAATYAAAAVTAGALGNLIDRLRLGYVVDFIDAHWGAWHWYVFNVADAAISVGAVALFVFTFLDERKGRKKAGEETAASPPPGSA